MDKVKVLAVVVVLAAVAVMDLVDQAVPVAVAAGGEMLLMETVDLVAETDLADLVADEVDPVADEADQAAVVWAAVVWAAVAHPGVAQEDRPEDQAKPKKQCPGKPTCLQD